jgi:hypothetical protein
VGAGGGIRVQVLDPALFLLCYEVTWKYAQS